MNKKANLRYQETEISLILALLRLLSQKELSRITIQEICRISQIHRTSFYLHFRDLHDLMEKADLYLMIQYAPTREQFKNPEERFSAFFDFIKEYRSFYSAYLNARHELHWLEGEPGYHRAFFQAGLTALTREWLKAGCPQTGKELAGILAEECRL